jgi:RNA recognition motif-containing protein
MRNLKASPVDESKRNRIEEAIEKSAKSAKEGRLIVRNVGFNVNLEQLRKRFEDYGELVDVVLPPSKRTSPMTADGRKMRIPPHAGYAFVEFDTREQAQSAITAVNGNRIGGRPVAVDFAYDSRIYKVIKEKGVVPTASSKPEPEPEESDDDLFQEDPKPEIETPAPKRQKTSEPPKETSNEPVTDARKLFLINVPFEATRKDVEEGLTTFGSLEAGAVESILFIKDKDTQKPTGKCFVIFSSEQVASSVLALEDSSKPQLFGDLYKNKDGRASVAPLEGVGCVILDRRVSIMKPLSKKDLEERKQKMEEENQPKNPKVVNRKNIDYINAGWINETHEELWADLPPKDQKMRLACNDEKKFKVKNPNYVINTKRLTIRNVPKQMENGDLQTAILKAMGIAGPKKVKQAGILKVAIVKDKVMVAVGDRKPKEEDFDMNAPESDDEEKMTENYKMEMKERKRSRGFAFMDFADPERAMKCLESMNNVPGAFGEEYKNRRPIVEFSFDDVRKLQIQKQRLVKQPVAPVEPKAKRDPAKLSRGQRQRAKRRAMREQAS